MSGNFLKRLTRQLLPLGVVVGLLAACVGNPDVPTIADAPESIGGEYLIGSGDALQIFVWRNPELSLGVAVRPDGRISVPLIEELEAAGKTPVVLAREIEASLGKFIQDPVVTVIVSGFVGVLDQQIRVVGEAALPRSIPYRVNMTALDVMIEVGGLTEFANGNGAVLVRKTSGESVSYRLRLDDLLKDGDVSANAEMLPGDIVIIPQSWL